MEVIEEYLPPGGHEVFFVNMTLGLPLKISTVHCFGLGNAVHGTFYLLLEMPFESTLLHFTCLSCSNSAHSRNEAGQSSKLYTLPNGIGACIGLCVHTSPQRLESQ
jgi:hypothetical protein